MRDTWSSVPRPPLLCPIEFERYWLYQDQGVDIQRHCLGGSGGILDSH
jgi:hypothetical protein